MIALYGLLVYALGLAVVGAIVLVLFPVLGFTFGNLALFVVGGFTGMAIGGCLVFLIFQFTAEPNRIAGFLALPIVFVGGVTSGTGLVWLKTYFAKRAGAK